MGNPSGMSDKPIQEWALEYVNQHGQPCFSICSEEAFLRKELDSFCTHKRHADIYVRTLWTGTEWGQEGWKLVGGTMQYEIDGVEHWGYYFE